MHIQMMRWCDPRISAPAHITLGDGTQYEPVRDSQSEIWLVAVLAQHVSEMTRVGFRAT